MGAKAEAQYRQNDVLSICTNYSNAHYNYCRRGFTGTDRNNLSFEHNSFALYAAQDLCGYPDAQEGTQRICFLADNNLFLKVVIGIIC